MSCCAPNLTRLLASLSGYLATVTGDGIQIHQYAPAEISTVKGGEPFRVRVADDRPGAVTIEVMEAPETAASLTLRNPDWSHETTLRLNGLEPVRVTDGAVTLSRVWSAGDVVALTLDMTPG